MKKYSLLLISLFATFIFFAQPKVQLEEKTHKFPKTKEGIQLKHTYQITNSGDVPLLLDKYEVACTCTKAIFQKTPILPNKTVDIIVTFDTKGKIGWQDREITLYSNAENSPTKLRFKVMVDNK